MNLSNDASPASSGAPPRERVATAAPVEPAWSRSKVGIASFFCTEAAFFGTLITTYIVYIGRSVSGPMPAEVLRLSIVAANTAFLLSSSVTIALAGRAFGRRARGRFLLYLGATILLAALFLGVTGFEWTRLIVDHGLTPQVNLFGTTSFTLIGFHALHVTMGIAAMLVLLGLALRGLVTAANASGVEMVSWYWHFVDVVWIVIFSVVYLIGR